MVSFNQEQKKLLQVHSVFDIVGKLVQFIQIPLIVGAGVMLIFILGETVTMDWRLSFVFMRGANNFTNKVAIASIDEETIYYDFIQQRKTYSPLDRSYLDSLIKAIEDYQPAVVGLDILLEAPSDNPDTDNRLSKTLAKFPNMVIGSSLYFPPHGFPLELAPSPLFTHNTTLIGFANIMGMSPAQGTTKMRQYKLVEEASGEIIPSFAYSLYLNYLYSRKNPNTWLTGDLLRGALQEGILSFMDSTALNHTSGLSGKNLYVNYSGGAPVVISARQIYHHLVNPDYLRNKIVLVGGFSERLRDNFETSVGRLPGVMIHSYIVSNLLENQVLKYPTFRLQFLFSIFFVLLGLLFLIWKGTVRGLYYTWLFLFIYWLAVFLLFWQYPAMWLPLNSPSLAVIGLTLCLFALHNLDPKWRESIGNFLLSIRTVGEKIIFRFYKSLGLFRSK